MNAHTYAEIASDIALWNEFVNVDGAFSAEEFSEMTIEQKIALQVEAFGPEALEQPSDLIAESVGCYVLNATGAEMVNSWLQSIARDPIRQNLEAWATEAENAANNAGPEESIIIEMRGMNTASGRPETLTLPRSAFDLVSAQ